MNIKSEVKNIIETNGFDVNLFIEELEKLGLVIVAVKPSRGLLVSMAVRWAHDFFVPNNNSCGISTGFSPSQRESLINSMSQLHEEVVGSGFWSIERDSDYANSVDSEES